VAARGHSVKWLGRTFLFEGEAGSPSHCRSGPTEAPPANFSEDPGVRWEAEMARGRRRGTDPRARFPPAGTPPAAVRVPGGEIGNRESRPPRAAARPGPGPISGFKGQPELRPTARGHGSTQAQHLSIAILAV
jgi:hypothetical protein